MKPSEKVLGALKRLQTHMDRRAIETIIELAPEVSPNDEYFQDIINELSAIDGIKNPLLMLYQVDLALRLADSLIKMLEKSDDDIAKAYLAYMYLFKADILSELDDPSRTEAVKQSIDIIKSIKKADDIVYPLVLTRAYIKLVKRLEYRKQLEEALKLSDEAIELLHKLENPESIRGDPNILVFLARAVSLGSKKTKEIKDILERLGFIKDGYLRVSPFVLAVFSKDIEKLSKAIGIKRLPS